MKPKSARFRAIAAILAITDVILAAVCGVAAFKLRYLPHSAWDVDAVFGHEDFQHYLPLILFAPFVRLFSGFILGLYQVKRKPYRLTQDVPQLFSTVSLGSAILIIVAFFGLLQLTGPLEYRAFTYSRFFFLFDWLLNLAAIIATHSLIGIIRGELARRGVMHRRIAVQGIGTEGRSLAANHDRLAESGYTIIGFIAQDYDEDMVEVEGGSAFPYLGDTADILTVINEYQLDEIVVTNVGTLEDKFLAFIDVCHKLDVVVKYVPDLSGLLYQGQPVEEVGGLPVIQVNEIAIVGLPRIIKRMEDVALSLAGILVLSPILILTAIMIRLDSPGPIIFAQERIGKNGRRFRMYKFRSMHQDAERQRGELAQANESDGVLFKVKEDPRITRVGRIIRKASIDELPQLFNVLAGEMSLIGPRPLPISDVSRPDDWEPDRFTAIPGITGLWQVNRTEHTTEEMLKWDLYYVEHWSLALDFQILMKTFFVVLTGRGAY